MVLVEIGVYVGERKSAPNKRCRCPGNGGPRRIHADSAKSDWDSSMGLSDKAKKSLCCLLLDRRLSDSKSTQRKSGLPCRR